MIDTAGSKLFSAELGKKANPSRKTPHASESKLHPVNPSGKCKHAIYQRGWVGEISGRQVSSCLRGSEDSISEIVTKQLNLFRAGVAE